MNKLKRKERVQASATPIRQALKAESSLRSKVKEGLGAIITSHLDYFDASVRTCFADSIDVDAALKVGRERENRWDYLLGHKPTKEIIGVEPHSAQNDEIATVIKKRHSAQLQLQEHLRDGVKVSKWFWVASGSVKFSPMEKATFRLAQHGIKFVGRKILNTHLS